MSTSMIFEDLRAMFPGWTIWQSSADRLWATRNQRLTDAQMDRGLSHAIDGDDIHQIVERLRDQECLAVEAC